MSTISAPDLITCATACLAAARSDAPIDVRAFYAATSRSAIEQLDEKLRILKLNLGAVELELARQAAKVEPGRLTGKERGT